MCVCVCVCVCVERIGRITRGLPQDGSAILYLEQVPGDGEGVALLRRPVMLPKRLSQHALNLLLGLQTTTKPQLKLDGSSGRIDASVHPIKHWRNDSSSKPPGGKMPPNFQLLSPGQR